MDRRSEAARKCEIGAGLERDDETPVENPAENYLGSSGDGQRRKETMEESRREGCRNMREVDVQNCEQ